MAVSRRDLVLALAATGGALAWTVQLWLSWLIADLGCFAQPGEWTLLGLGVMGWWLVIGLVTGAMAIGATWLAYRLWSRRPDDGRPEGGRRFVAGAGLALNLLLVATIALGATSPLLLPPCT
jgi:hypothetical protein